MNKFVLPEIDLEVEEDFYFEMSKVLYKMGEFTTQWIEKIFHPKDDGLVEPQDLRKLKHYYETWNAYLIENFDFLMKVKMLPVGPDSTPTVPHCTGFQIFMEICRLKIIIYKDDLYEFAEWRFEHHQNFQASLGIVGSFVPPEVPVWLYTQSEISKVLFSLPIIINQLVISEELIQFLTIVDLRISSFFVQTFPGDILDVDSRRIEVNKRNPHLDTEDNKRCTINREFWIFTSNYLTTVIRKRIFFDELIPKRQLNDDIETYVPSGSTDRLKDWMMVLSRGLEENYEEVFANACKEAFSFPGDTWWFTYKYPHLQVSPENVLVTIRKDMHKEFFKESSVSYEVALNQTSTHFSSVVYIINLLDRYFKIFKCLEWKDGFVIFNDDVVDNFEKLANSRDPFLVQFFSSFWVYWGGNVVQVDDIYLAICLWFLVVRKTRDNAGLPKDVVFGGVYIGEEIDKVLYGKEKNITTKRKHQKEEEEKVKEKETQRKKNKILIEL